MKELVELYKSKHYKSAIDRARQILQANPSSNLCIQYKGLSHYYLGQYQQAIECFQSALATDQNNHDLLINLGQALNGSGEKKEALTCFQQAISVQPESLHGYYYIANFLVSQSKNYEAVSICITALSLQSTDTQTKAYIKNTLGFAYMRLQKLEQAANIFREVIQQYPKNVKAYYGLGVNLFYGGHNDESIENFKKAISLQPDHVGSYNMLVKIINFNEQKDMLPKMEQLYNQYDLSNKNKISLSFSLGKAYDDLQEHDKAFSYFKVGNQLKRQGIQNGFNPRTHGFYKFLFNQDMYSNHTQHGINDESLVFIVGMPRSGTSLAEQILATHPAIYGGGELVDIHDIYTTSIQQLTAKQVLEKYMSISGSAISQLANTYLKAINPLKGKHQFFIDKNPINYLNVGFIKLLFPKAKIIHSHRHPLDNCLSLYQLFFEIGNLYSFDLEDLGNQYNHYSDLMKYWQQLFPQDIYDLEYENVVSDMQAETTKLLAFLGLDWDDSCMDFHNNKRTITTPSSSQVRQPLYTSSVGKWKNYQQHLAPLIKTLKEELL